MLAMSRFHPRLVDELRRYDRAKLLSDLSAGLRKLIETAACSTA